jgi:hypothetical protein
MMQERRHYLNTVKLHDNCARIYVYVYMGMLYM